MKYILQIWAHDNVSWPWKYRWSLRHSWSVSPIVSGLATSRKGAEKKAYRSLSKIVKEQVDTQLMDDPGFTKCDSQLLEVIKDQKRKKKA